jgi:hypothetical protein
MDSFCLVAFNVVDEQLIWLCCLVNVVQSGPGPGPTSVRLVLGLDIFILSLSAQGPEISLALAREQIRAVPLTLCC